MEAFINVDFHNHTCYSHDSMLKVEKLILRARERGLHRLVITDHDTIEGALYGKRLDPELVIVGEEIQTTCGELLAAYVCEPVPEGLTPLDAIRRLKDQGAFISVSHPQDRYRGWLLPDLLEILPYVDALEVFNARCIHAEDNTNAQLLACKHKLPGTVGSDAHTAFEVGNAYIQLPWFNDAEELRNVVGQGEIIAKAAPAYVHFFTTSAKQVKRIQGKFHKSQSLDVRNS